MVRDGAGETAAGRERPVALSVKDLRKSFGPLTVLDGISFDVRKQEVIGVIGASGSGKSTMLRCLNLLETPTSGVVELRGARIGYRERPDGKLSRLSGREIAKQRALMGMVFQAFNLWPHRTVLQNVTEGPIVVKGISQRDAEATAMKFLEKVGLLEKASSYPARLSGGQQQRVAIARALAMEPEILLFDEPTSSLDPELVGEVLKVISDLAAEGTTMIIVTHEMRFANDACDRVIFLEKGRVADDGTPNHIFGPTAGERTKEFVASYTSGHQSRVERGVE